MSAYKELLLRVVTKLAKSQLERGGLMPFAATLNSKREVKVLMPDKMKREVTRDELETYWDSLLRKEVENGIVAACTCANFGFPREDGTHVPGLLICFEQADGTAEDVGYPCWKNDDDTISLGEPTAVVVKPRIFPRDS